MNKATAALVLAMLALANVSGAWVSAGPSVQSAKKLRVVIFGGHPDDQESGAGGLAALLSKAGHEVILAYGTTYRGDRHFFNRPEAEVRQGESAAACKILGATPKFFPYAHEKLVADAATLHDVSTWLEEIKPDIVVAHWPLDTHENHHAVSSLVWQCYKRKGGWNLYFFEVETDLQSIAFKPELYLDIEPVREIKRQALFEHKSQAPEKIWVIHEQMHVRRGAECGVAFAEGYLLVEPKENVPLLPVAFLRRKP